MPNRLIHANSLDKQMINKNSVDLTVASHPCNVVKAHDGKQPLSADVPKIAMDAGEKRHAAIISDISTP